MAEVKLSPQNTGLLIQDMQNDIVKSGRPVVPLGETVLIANCKKLLVQARKLNVPVLYVQVTRRPDGRDIPKAALGSEIPLGAPPIVAGSQGAEIVTELSPLPSEPIITKHTTSPFNTTDIEVYLRRFGINTLILTGYSTTGVVEGSLRDAKDKDYDCIVAKDCCSAATEQEHLTCMDIVFPRMAWVASGDEIIAAFGR